MKQFVILLRGINVGGKNKLSMAELRDWLGLAGYEDVQTYIQSGNILLNSDKSAAQIARDIEKRLPTSFRLDSSLIRVRVLSSNELETVMKAKPNGFGDNPETYHSDVVFLMDITVNDALMVFDPRDGVDTIWPGETVIYSQRLSAERTRSRLNKIIGTPAYQHMTIRNWNTVKKLHALLSPEGES